jgi:hypothetical protein
MQIPMQPLWKTVWEKKNPKNRTAIWSSNSTPRNIPEGIYVRQQ